ncbi:MAG: hypothetical protein KAJ19_28705, partial [Gammaproteobacteria bacterium]|nr:hypothetical protein [Gammaproteobacteria bacterium]
VTQYDGANWELARWTGTSTNAVLDQAPMTVNEGEWWFSRIRREGQTFMSRHWQHGTKEPKDWLNIATDSTYFLAGEPSSPTLMWYAHSGITDNLMRIAWWGMANGGGVAPLQYPKKKAFSLVDTPSDVRFATTRKIWTNQPPEGTQLDTDNPITKGMIIAVPFNDNSTEGVDDVGQLGRDYSGKENHATVLSTATRIGRNLSKAGLGVTRAWDFTALTNYLAYFTFKGYNKNEGTMMWWFMRKWDDTLPQWPTVIYPNVSGSGQNQMFWNNTSDQWSFNFVPGGANLLVRADAISQYEWAQCAMVWSVAQNFSGAYVNGVLENSGVYSSPASDITQLRYVDPTNNEGDAEYGPLYHWSRALSAGEVQSVAQRPWQIFKPRTIHVPFPEKLPDLARIEKPW